MPATVMQYVLLAAVVLLAGMDIYQQIHIADLQSNIAGLQRSISGLQSNVADIQQRVGDVKQVTDKICFVNQSGYHTMRPCN